MGNVKILNLASDSCFLPCRRRLMIVIYKTYDTIVHRMDAWVTLWFRRIFDATPINFRSDRFFAHIEKSTTTQLKVPLLTRNIFQWHVYIWREPKNGRESRISLKLNWFSQPNYQRIITKRWKAYFNWSFCFWIYLFIDPSEFVAVAYRALADKSRIYS